MPLIPFPEQTFGKRFQFAGALVVIGIAAAAFLGSELLSSLKKGVVRASRRNVLDTRELTAFDRVEIDGQIQADVILGGKPSITFEAPSDMLPYLKPTVENGVLHVQAHADVEAIKAHIVTVKLSGVSLRDRSRLDLSSPTTVPSFSVFADGFSVFYGALKADRLSIQLVDGSANIQGSEGRVEVDAANASYCSLAKGKAEELTLRAGDKCNVDCNDFTFKQARVTAFGNACVYLNVTGPLSVNSTGSPRVLNHNKPALHD